MIYPSLSATEKLPSRLICQNLTFSVVQQVYVVERVYLCKYCVFTLLSLFLVNFSTFFFHESKISYFKIIIAFFNWHLMNLGLQNLAFVVDN